MKTDKVTYTERSIIWWDHLLWSLKRDDYRYMFYSSHTHTHTHTNEINDKVFVYICLSRSLYSLKHSLHFSIPVIYLCKPQVVICGKLFDVQFTHVCSCIVT